MALPFVHSVSAQATNPVHVLCPESLQELFHSAKTKVLGIPAGLEHGTKGILIQAKLLRPYRFSLGFALTPSFSSAAALYLGKVKRRVGVATNGRGFLLTDSMPSAAGAHRSQAYLSLLKPGGLEADQASVSLELSTQEIENTYRLLSDNGLGRNEPFVAIAFRAVAPSRRWGIENYANLVTRLHEIGLRSVITGTKLDREEGNRLMELSSGAAINVAGQTTIRTLAALYKMSAAFVGNDSGSAHLAACAGARCVILSGADVPDETTPLTVNKTVIRRSELPCISCLKNHCPLKGEAYMQCMHQIPVTEVFEAIKSLLCSGPEVKTKSCNC